MATPQLVSGVFGHRVNHSLALGYVTTVLAKGDAGFEIEIIGERRTFGEIA